MKIYTLRLLKNTRHYMFRTFTLALLACHFPLGAGIFLDINTNTDQLIFTVDGGSSISSGTFNQWFVDDGNVQNQTFAEFLTITDFTKTGGTGLSSSSDVNDFRLLEVLASPATINSFVLGSTSAFSDWSGTIIGTLNSGSLSGITTINTINSTSIGSTSPSLATESFTPAIIPEPNLFFCAAFFLILSSYFRKKVHAAK